jgi:universal stress protein A
MMFQIKTLLLPVDFSERSLEAARQAKAIVRHFHCRLIVLNVDEVDRKTSLQFEPDGWSAEGLQAYFDREFADTPIQYVAKEGDSAQVIAEQARTDAADLIVIAGHTRNPFEDFALGSVTADLLSSAPCPVWVSLHDEKGPPPLFRRILCAVDLSDQSAKVSDWAVAFANAFSAACDIIHVSDGGEDEVGHTTEDSLPRIEREAVDRIRAKLGTRGEVILATGGLETAVGGISKELRSDLLVIGRSLAGNAIDHVHSASYKLVHNAPCPVVCI